METELLKSFVTVAEELHFGRAAEKRHIAQPALSRHVQRLEGELGAALFDRDRRNVALTEAGRIYLDEARAILERVEYGRRRVERARRGEVGEISFGYEAATLYNVFPDIVRLYREKYPDVSLFLHEMVTEDQISALAEDRLDVGLIHPEFTPKDLEGEIVFREPVVVALPDTHPLAGEARVEVADLAADPFILFPRRFGPEKYDRMIGLCAAAGFAPNVVQEAESKQGMVGLVAAGIGVALLPASVSSLRRGGVVYAEIDDADRSMEMGLVWNPKRATPVLTGFLDTAREACRGLNATDFSGAGVETSAGVRVPAAR
ncbi:MAG: Transcriptional regulator, LysR family [uncultured Rubrobacteraceae bacterium]|uniref:Transcriptional regulator, LysR family n=1 Tax=uncultured Rubrobacteraceae bacterium TaxID=349277 RepID=A0A6J4PXE3_9ACTN|nr:MAG: Transcriptional regulator, LysR family [uncultured Rubrobacteraceae bacterium]